MPRQAVGREPREGVIEPGEPGPADFFELRVDEFPGDFAQERPRKSFAGFGQESVQADFEVLAQSGRVRTAKVNPDPVGQILDS